MESVRFDLRSVEARSAELHGLVACRPRSKGTYVHVHGTWGNFYANPFVMPIADMVVASGFDYATVNVLGHDEQAIHEKFSEAKDSLDAWLKVLRPPFVLQGHSLGALKVVAYLSVLDGYFKDSVAGLVLLSPFDVVAFYLGTDHDVALDRRTTLESLRKAGQGDSLVPSNLFDLWLLSVNTMYELTTEGAISDVFPFRNKLKHSPIHELGCPALSIIGGADFAAIPNPNVAFELLAQASAVSSRCIDRAPHNFADHTEELSHCIRSFLNGIAL